MTTSTASGSLDAIDLTTGIVAAYVSNNAVQTADLPDLISSVHAALIGLSGGTVAAASPVADAERPSAAQIRKSIRDDGIVSFIDGKAYKTLKRHLTGHGLDPKSYRERYGLPADYPMVAPNYAAQRSALAKAIGLGRPGAQAERRAA
ncbi:MucR family transcriptional regulator [Methylobacterium sp. 092160098-2]|jgi:predicted transcriptional regulator|uniref:MucR family transcriptional regulator n=1 Tax=Methylobacterium sp. 092160098-2 TaxID=3025129 RepID=UPI002381B90E|nr:MucR family transcriptional regulator [Methylobacterium sp. 092160098-2]MDE4914766.1 MucR family transcriptional regulator [Methylobacterium sp. 092160098-2]